MLAVPGLASISPDRKSVVILSAAMPMFGVCTVLAQKQGQEGIASITLLAATSLAFVALSALLLWLS